MKIALVPTAALIILCLSFSPTHASPRDNVTTIELSAEAAGTAANEMASVTVWAEAAGNTLEEISAQVKRRISDALEICKTHPDIRVKHGGTHSYPVYAQGNRIESWRMRSQLILQTKNIAALAELLGKLDASLGISSLNLQPLPETLEKAENEAIIAAMRAFRARAEIVARSFGRPYHIKHMAIGSTGKQGGSSLRPAARNLSSRESNPFPLETGETDFQIRISGQIELK